MARKQALPEDQLDRLNDRYRRERDALVALAKTRIAVEAAACQVEAASGALEQARHGEHEAYQEVVALVGADAAAELTGRASNQKAARGRGPSRPQPHAVGGEATSPSKRERLDPVGEVAEE